jgi:hypothetical protein
MLKKLALFSAIFLLSISFASSQNVMREPLCGYLLNGKWHILDHQGKDIFKPLDLVYLTGYSEGFLRIAKAFGKDTAWGFLNLEGNVAIPPGAKFIDQFHDGVAILVNWRKDLPDVKYYGYIRNDGVVIAPPMFLDATEFNEEFAFVMNDTVRGWMNKDGKIVKKLEKGFGEAFYEGLAVVQDTVPKFGYVDTNFNTAIPFIFNEAHNFSEGVARVEYDGYYGFINKSGKFVIRPKFFYAHDMVEGRIFVASSFGNSKTKWSIYTLGNKFLTEFIFDDVRDFSEGFACVQQDSVWHFVDIWGDAQFGKKYKFVDSFKNGLAWVSELDDSKRGFINPIGEYEVVIPKEAETIIDLRWNRFVK